MSEGAKDTLRNVVQNYTCVGQLILQMLEKNEALKAKNQRRWLNVKAIGVKRQQGSSV